MKRSTARWTTTFAAAALLGLPSAGWSQTPPSAPAPTSQQAPAAGQSGAAQEAAAAAAQQAATPQSSSPDETKRHLSAARDSLSQLTQLPAAAQLQGEPRDKVSQLIADFNELITTKENWRASYDKLNGNLMMLLGSETAAPAQPAPTGTPGAVGTSGAVTLDPAIRGKLVEFKEHLMKFEKAAASGAASPTPSASASEATTSPTPAASASEAATSPAQKSADSPMSHVDAIEAILNAPPASGQAATSGLTLNSTQVEQLRTHLAEIRKALDRK